MHKENKSSSSRPPRVLLLSALGVESVVGEAVSHLVGERIATKGGAVTSIALRSCALPLFDGEGDLKTFPQGAKELAEIVANHDALMLLASEYHHGIAPLIKNSLDWSGRAHFLTQGGNPLLYGKPVGIVTLSPEKHLGVQAMTQMSSLCYALGARVLPGSMGIPDLGASLGEDHLLKDPALVKRLSALVDDLVGRKLMTVS